MRGGGVEAVRLLAHHEGHGIVLEDASEKVT